MREAGTNRRDLTGVGQRIGALSPEKRALLAWRLLEMSRRTASHGRIVPHDRLAPCPLSFAQRRLWFLDQLLQKSGLYNIGAAVRLRGTLDMEALRGALETLVARHEVLRTTFRLDGGKPVQLVNEAQAVELPILDLRDVPDVPREERLGKVLRCEARRPFDLTTDLMLRGVLVRLRAEEHVLLLTLHHIAADGWSMRIVARELSELYAARCERRSAALPPLSIQYADYAIWQRAASSGDAFRRQRAYWSERLADLRETLPLPVRPRPAVRTYRGGRETRVLPSGLAAALETLSRREHVTLFMTLLAAFKTLLQCYAGTDDVVIGTAVAGRRDLETEGLIGFFVNTLILRTNLGGDPSFRELLRRVRETVVGAYDHQDVPFEQLVEELRPERSPSRTPLLHVMFTLESGEPWSFDFPGLTADPVPVSLGLAKFDLTVTIRCEPAGLRVTLGYDTDLYDEGTITRMLGHYETLLAGAASDPDRPLSVLPLLTDAEVHRYIVACNATTAPFPQDAGIAELFEAQAARTPGAVAVTCGERSLTYDGLNRRANELAHFLRGLGVGPDVAVGVSLAPSVELIVGLLGILKAGGAYVPLDLSYPSERLRFMLEDARVTAVLTQRHLASAFAEVTVPLVLVEDVARTARADNPPHTTGGEHLAYLMYTSGSTGRPKAVAVPQRGVARLVVGANYVTITDADVVAQASSPSFDASTFEIWGALLNGARLAVIPRDVAVSPAGLHGAIERYGITILFLTTALFNQMARDLPSAFRGLRTLLFGGETADPQSVDRVLMNGAPERLIHVYGPTEATTFACWYPVQGVLEGATGIPIGRPVSNTQVYVLDRNMRPVPVGLAGELHIGGPGVARGYLNCADLTADKFIPDPFRASSGARLFKTGDLARYLPDGTIEFLGRLDDQVKIRGHRIEPGEVDAVLRRHPEVRDAVTVARDDTGSERYLVTYAVPVPSSTVSPAALRDFLKQRLPSYMVPARIGLLGALPLNPNGKIDRHALPALPNDRSGVKAPFTPPTTTLEHQLQEIWEETLGTGSIGSTDNFFDLGGHSLLAVQLMQRIEQAVGRRLPVALLFEHATIQGLARALLDVPLDSPGRVTTFHGDGARPPFFFLPGDYRGGGLYCMELARALGTDQPLVILHPHGVDGDHVPGTIEAMADDLLVTLRALKPHGPYRLGGYCNGGLVAFEVARRLQQRGDTLEFLAVLDASAENARFSNRVLRQLVTRFGSIGGLAPQERMVRWRTAGRRLGERMTYYRRRLPQLASMRPAERAAVLRRQGSRSRAFVRSLLRLGTDSQLDACSVSTAEDLNERRRAELDDIYRRATTWYVPRHYRGMITVFRSSANRARRPDLWWRLVAPAVEVHEMPGDHMTSVTRYVEVVGARLTACLLNLG